MANGKKNMIGISADFGDKLDLLKLHFNVSSRAQVIEEMAKLDYSQYKPASWDRAENQMFDIVSWVEYDDGVAQKLDQLMPVFRSLFHVSVVGGMMHAILQPLHEKDNWPLIPH